MAGTHWPHPPGWKEAQDDKQRVRLCNRSGCKNPANRAHTCPYASEINGDDTTKCKCCDSCTQECAWDI